MKEEIISSYLKLIEDCEDSIKKGIEKEKNLLLMSEYLKVLDQVQQKSERDYDCIKKEMKRISSFQRNFAFDRKE